MLRIGHILFHCISNQKFRLVQACFLMFFLELVLIRWIGANIFSLAFFSNFVLIGSFLGLGVGFLHSKSTRNLFSYAPMLLALLFFCCYYFHYQYQININPNTDDLVYFDHLFRRNLFPVAMTLPVMFVCVVIVMITIGDGVGKTFSQFPPLQAYRLDILGSLLGIATFTIFAFMQIGPLGWCVMICLLLTSLLLPQWRSHTWLLLVQITAMASMLGITVYHDKNAAEYYWSPYYKIAVENYSHGRYAVLANGMPQQFIESVAQRKKYKPFYFLPYQHLPANFPLNNVLIIGAGTGGDVAIALAEGAKHVDAIEIDPVLYTLGKKYNPNHAYADTRVHVIINDGRAYLQQTKMHYDMVVFALPDSLLVISGQSSLRLESYLFTVESMTQVLHHLTPHGVFTMYNYYREPWFVNRLANTTTLLFGHKPCVDSYGPANLWLSVLTISRATTGLTCPALWQGNTTQYSTPITDDHPFLYLKDSHISSVYLFTLLFILFVAATAIHAVGGSYRSIKQYPTLFLMGIAFFLLETKNISNFALLFGTTWIVNALVFAGILIVVYLAIELVHRNAITRTLPWYIALLATLTLSWLIKNSDLLVLPLLPRYIVATALAFSPIFMANILFSQQFRRMRHATDAFSVNLLGAVIGGLLEYSAVLIGYRDLLIISAIIYTLAVVLIPKNEFARLIQSE